MAEVAGYKRKTKSGQVIEVKDYKNAVAGAVPQLPAAPDPMKELRERPGRPPLLATPGQFPGGRVVPGHGAPIVDHQAVEAVREEGLLEQETQAFDDESRNALETDRAQRHAEDQGFTVERDDPQTASALDKLKKAGVKVKRPKVTLAQANLLALSVGLEVIPVGDDKGDPASGAQGAAGSLP